MQRLTDKGTRYEFLQDLKSMWEDALTMISNQSYVSFPDKTQIESLQAGIECLEKTLLGMTGFIESQGELKTIINRGELDGGDSISRSRWKLF
jgi:hypothetical protein